MSVTMFTEELETEQETKGAVNSTQKLHPQTYEVVAVWDEFGLGGQRMYHVAESRERLVNALGFDQSFIFGACL